MMAKQYQINGLTFKTQQSLLTHVRQILYACKDLQRLPDPDFAFMLDLLKRHPDSEQKIGSGVEFMTVKRNPLYPCTCTFFVVRHDGTETDFSFLECVRETPHGKRFVRACRAAVESGIQEFKQAHFNSSGGVARCPYTGETLKYVGSHVDHVAPDTFQSLVDRFISENGIDVQSVQLDGNATDNTYQDTFCDKDLERVWIDFHWENARLQVVSKTANLSILKY